VKYLRQDFGQSQNISTHSVWIWQHCNQIGSGVKLQRVRRKSIGTVTSLKIASLFCWTVHVLQIQRIQATNTISQ